MQQVVRNFVKSMDIPYPIVIAPEECGEELQSHRDPNLLFSLIRRGRSEKRSIGFNSTIAQQMTAKVVDLTSEKP